MVVPGHGSGDRVPVTVGGVPVAMVESGELISVLNRDATAALMSWNAAIPRSGKGKTASSAPTAGLPGFSIGGILGGLADSALDGLASLVSKGVGALPSPADYMPSWLVPMGKSIVGDVASWVKDKVASILPFGSADPSKFSGSAIASFTKMVAQADRMDAMHTSYKYGGGHGSFAGPWDCSGAVSAVLHAGGLLSSPMTTDGLKTWGSAGNGGLVTVGVRGSTGREAHTMMLLGSKGFESGGSNGGAGWTGGWDGVFPIHRHPAGMNTGGIIGTLSELFSPQRVGWGLSTGGTIPYVGSYESGGVLPRTGYYLGHKGERVTPAGGGPVVELKFDNGMEWLRDFVRVEIRERDREDHGNYLTGARP
jgi:hypothetical protein